MRAFHTLFVFCAFFLAASSVTAQFQFPGYLPRACEATAKVAIDGATDGVVVGILAAGVEIPLGTTPLFIGMDLDAGTAPVWIYLVYSQQLDTVAVVPLIRLLGSCSAPPVDPGDLSDLGTEDFGRLPLPAGYLQGTDMTNKLKANADFIKFNAAHPDSQPTVSAISTSTEEFLDFPTGTPFWSLLWIPAGGEGFPFTCLVHAVDGTTICLGEEIMSVANEARDAGFSVAPNPSSEDAVITLPMSWVGSSVTVDAVDATGRIVNITNTSSLTYPQVFINTGNLSSGMWSLRISNHTAQQVLPLSVLH